MGSWHIMEKDEKPAKKKKYCSKLMDFRQRSQNIITQSIMKG